MSALLRCGCKMLIWCKCWSCHTTWTDARRSRVCTQIQYRLSHSDLWRFAGLLQAATSPPSVLTLRSEQWTSTESELSCRSGTQRGRRDSEPSHQRKNLQTRTGFMFRNFPLSFWPVGASLSSFCSIFQVLQKHPRCHYCLRRDKSGVVCKC